MGYIASLLVVLIVGAIVYMQLFASSTDLSGNEGYTADDAINEAKEVKNIMEQNFKNANEN